MNDRDLVKARYGEWLASLVGACGVTLGLGIYFAEYLGAAAPWLLLLGVALHGWGMYKIRQHNT